MGEGWTRVLRWVVAVSLVVAAVSCVSAVNWNNTWSSFAGLDVSSSGGATSVATVEAEGMFHQWVLVALAALVVAAITTASLWLRQARAEATGEVADSLGAVPR